MTHLRETILKKIHEKEVVMRPRWPFVLRGILRIILVAVVICFALFVMMVLMVALRENGLMQLPAFGAPGLFHFFINLPWLIILGVFIALIIVEILFKKFSFGYRTPALITLGVIGVGTVLGGLFLSSIGPRAMTDRIRNNAFVRSEMMREGPEFIRQKPLTHGIIRELNVSDMLLETEDETVRVLFDESTRFPDGKEILFVGSPIFVGGLRNGSIIKAFGISNEPPELKFYRMRK
ncbi:hypothetical protein C4565_02670 [Candidatus Parcubacteria bacterium]|jgi:hypothetical protein|nr:MAG: hypothetical protein C4565_02670 [Candidatus Parcubacteria bacterium]